MYFDTNESKSHKEAKEKLFDLIISDRIDIIDQFKNQYNIFKGEYGEEFLHIESFVMDYSSKALFSSKESPCRKHLEEYKKSPHCELEGYYGAFRELPCERCVASNFRKYIEGSSKFASYRPDVSFGYGGEHKIWLEIKNESPCSKNKIDFCNENGIVLLEIEDKDVMRFNDFNGVLKFNKLEEYVHKVNFYTELEKVIEYAKREVDDKGYVRSRELINLLDDSLPDVVTPYQLGKYTKAMKQYFVNIEIKGKEIKNHFIVKKQCTAWISKEEYHVLIEKGYCNNDEAEVVVENTTKNIMRKCYKCKGKDISNNMIKTMIMHNGRQAFRYYHKGCYNKI